jgi:hypothetical protein
MPEIQRLAGPARGAGSFAHPLAHRARSSRPGADGGGDRDCGRGLRGLPRPPALLRGRPAGGCHRGARATGAGGGPAGGAAAHLTDYLRRAQHDEALRFESG